MYTKFARKNLCFFLICGLCCFPSPLVASAEIPSFASEQEITVPPPSPPAKTPDFPSSPAKEEAAAKPPAARPAEINEAALSSPEEQPTEPIKWDSTNMYAVSGGRITGFSTAYLEYVKTQAPDLVYADLILPADINGTVITSIGSSAFKSQQGYLPDNLRVRTIDLSAVSALTHIDDYAFYNINPSLYDELDSPQLILPEQLQTIGSNAFNGLHGLHGDLRLPDSIQTLGNSAFAYCGFDGTLTLPDNEQFTTIPRQLCQGDAFIGTLAIPEHVTAIAGNFAFEGNAFSAITWPDTLQSIGSSSFIDCAQLESIPPLPAQLQTLGDNVFKNCAQLSSQSIHLPDTLLSMGNTVFDGTPVQTVYLPDNPATVYAHHFFFDHSALTAIIASNAEQYDHFCQSQEDRQRKLAAYPVTLRFLNTDGSTTATREALYNQPLNFTYNPASDVWAADESCTLPDLSGTAPLGYTMSWSFQPSGGTAAEETTLVTGDTLYLTTTLQKAVLLTPTVNTLTKVYDGTPLTLEVQATHPLEGSAVGDIYFYYNFVRVQHYQGVAGYEQKSHQSVYNKAVTVQDSASSGGDWYQVTPWVCQITSPGHATFRYYLPDVYYYVTITPAAPVLHPIYADQADAGTALAEIALTASPDDTPGLLTWQDKNQVVTRGTHDYTWCFTPTDQDNYTPLTGTVSLQGRSAEAPLPPVASLPSGTYIGSQQITLQSEAPEDTILYTIDGSDPSSSSTAQRYQPGTPLYLNKTRILRTAAQDSAGRFSETAAYTYTIEPKSQAVIPPDGGGPLLPDRPDITSEQVDIVYAETVAAEQQDALLEALPSGLSASEHFFELHLTVNLIPQEGAQLSHKITVSIPYPGDAATDYKIAHLRADQTVEILDAQWYPAEGVLKFAVDSFSPFLVLTHPHSSSGGSTGSASTLEQHYTITALSGTGGRLSPAGQTACAAGSQKTWHILPNDRAIIRQVWVDDQAIGAVQTYTFSDIQADHTIRAEFLPQFDDVLPGAWYYDAVLSAYRQGQLIGTSTHTFSPDGPVDRAMAAALLHRLAGAPAAPAPAYTDVTLGTWYAAPIAWLTANHLASGYPDGSFHPTQAVTRQECAALLYRFADRRGLTLQAPDTALSPFTDRDQIAAWALRPMTWAAANGLFVGKTPCELAPAEPLTRAEFAALLDRFLAL